MGNIKIFDRYINYLDAFKKRVPQIQYHMNVLNATCFIKLGLKCLILSVDNIYVMENKFEETVEDFSNYARELELEEREDNAESNGKRSQK